jgi:uncharacterized membrane protein YfcA
MSLTEIILVCGAFVISIFNAAIGPTGGMSLAIIGSLMPPAAVVPMHGAVEAASSSFRVMASLRYVVWSVALPFGIGAMIGGLAGASINIKMPDDILQIVIGLFILYSVWAPKPKTEGGGGKGKAGLIGAITSFVGMLGGAVGALIMSFVGNAIADRRGVIATQSACVLFIHAFKMIAFGILGFSFAPYAEIILMMIAATFVGGLVGRRILDMLPETFFRKLFKVVVTILALRMLVIGFLGLI